jgi:diguanylate cyclase (GGDEF)-like protein/excisionase family DNA binding protein
MVMLNGLDAERAAGIRAQVGEAIASRRDLLAGDLAGALRGPLAGALEGDALNACASLIIDLLADTANNGRLDPRAGKVVDLQLLCPEPLSVRSLFESIHRASQVALDELALHEHLGATSEPWGLVSELVRLAALDLQVAVTERLIVTPAQLVVRDSLTTLVARPAFDVAMAKEVDRAQRRGHPIALILFDVDQLSSINRGLGYGAGDRLLERLGILARRFFRNDDWLGRHGEDSIAALLPETSLDDASALAHRFRRTVQQRMVLVDHRTDARVAVTVSAAVVASEKLLSHIDPNMFMAEAEAALLRAKMNGPNQMEQVTVQPASLSILGAANLLDCPPIEIRRLVRAGVLAAAKRGRHYHLDRASVERYRAHRAEAH